MIKAIIFDYDGVIVDSFKTIHEIYQQICADLNLICPASLEEFRRLYGYDAKEAQRNLGILPEDADKANAIFERLVLSKKPKLYEGIESVLKTLCHKYTLILATSNLESEARQKLKNYNIVQYFKVIVGKEAGKKFGKREAIPNLLTKLGLDKNEVVYIGDRDIDLDIAREVGIENVIIVEYGWGYQKARPHKFRIEKPVDIISAISEFDK